MTGTTPALARLTLDEAREILLDMEPKLFSLERLACAVSLAAAGLADLTSCDDAYALDELGVQIEALVKKIREEAYGCASADDGDGEVEEAEGDAS